MSEGPLKKNENDLRPDAESPELCHEPATGKSVACPTCGAPWRDEVGTEQATLCCKVCESPFTSEGRKLCDLCGIAKPNVANPAILVKTVISASDSWGTSREVRGSLVKQAYIGVCDGCLKVEEELLQRRFRRSGNVSAAIALLLGVVTFAMLRLNWLNFHRDARPEWQDVVPLGALVALLTSAYFFVRRPHDEAIANCDFKCVTKVLSRFRVGGKKILHHAYTGVTWEQHLAEQPFKVMVEM